MSDGVDPKKELTDEQILDELKNYPDELLKDPGAWMSMSDTLRRAAEIVQAEFLNAQRAAISISQRAAQGESVDQSALYEAQKNLNLHRVSQMLYQMSLENALKGLCVQQGKDAPRSHDLVELAKEAGLPLDQTEESKLSAMNRMNELGRFRVGGNPKKGYTHGTVGLNHIDKILKPIQDKIAKQYRDNQSR